jgi:hypothetical protein
LREDAMTAQSEIPNPYLRDAAARAASGQTEADARAVRARRRSMEASYRAEGMSETYIAMHVTDDLAAKVLSHEQKAIEAITGLFGGIGGRT